MRRYAIITRANGATLVRQDDLHDLTGPFEAVERFDAKDDEAAYERFAVWLELRPRQCIAFRQLSPVEELLS